MAATAKKKRRVLVVDDEPLVCDAVRMLLTIDGYEVETAADGEQALEKYLAAPFDLVLVDFEMPRMKGDQLAIAIKSRNPRQPILMLTAHGEMLRSSARPLAGVDLIVDKPFQLRILREGIAQVLAKYATDGAPPVDGEAH
ncbi:MAG TPA: response regulator [Dongiaceae bacterium]|jgi:CheY-like chemotaxis protein|nr:response regulator [Dongiaceae bacterium]